LVAYQNIVTSSTLFVVVFAWVNLPGAMIACFESLNVEAPGTIDKPAAEEVNRKVKAMTMLPKLDKMKKQTDADQAEKATELSEAVTARKVDDEFCTYACGGW
jgi:hypothetical protein